MQIISLAYDSPQFAACFAIRLEVFVDEQRVPLTEERDAQDATALHFLALHEGEALGTARVIFQDHGATAKITRVAVRKPARNRGLGAQLMAAIEADQALAGIGRFVLDAQLTALAFYERLGYAPLGGVFMEAGMAHRRMSKMRPASLFWKR